VESSASQEAHNRRSLIRWWYDDPLNPIENSRSGVFQQNRSEADGRHSITCFPTQQHGLRDRPV